MLDTYYENHNARINYGHSYLNNPLATDFHLHNWFEIYFFIAGDVRYFIEKKVYTLKYGDLLVLNSQEIHKPSFPSGGLYERIVIHFDAALVRMFNTSEFDLLNCFVNRPKGEKNKIVLSELQIKEVHKLLLKIEALGNCDTDSGKILKLTYFIEFLVYINKVFMNIPCIEEFSQIPEKLIPVFDYIDKNLDGDLSLDKLKRNFYIDSSYLCRLFKKSTGSSLHEYIIYKRLALSKKLLSEGASVMEACIKSGFNDYSNFARMFKRKVGVSPKRYTNVT